MGSKRKTNNKKSSDIEKQKTKTAKICTCKEAIIVMCPENKEIACKTNSGKCFFKLLQEQISEEMVAKNNTKIIDVLEKLPSKKVFLAIHGLSDFTNVEGLSQEAKDRKITM